MSPFTAAIFLSLGFLAGSLFFALLRWNTRLYTHGGSLVRAVAVQLARLTGVGGLLTIVAVRGALPLLLALVGLLIARPVVLRLMASDAV